MAKNKKKLLVVVGLVAALAVVSTLAYFFASTSIDNPFKTNKYGGETVEKFTPPTDWEPGEEVGKEVKATNTGTYGLLVRVKFDEKWTNAAGDFDKLSSSDTGFFPANATTSANPGSSVYKKLANLGTGKWVDGGDGYFYWDGVLEPTKSTDAILEAVTLCADADMGTYTTTMYYAVVDKNAQPTDNDWTTTEPEKNQDGSYKLGEGKELFQKKVVAIDPKNSGYADSTYTLTVTTDFCQASKDAADAVTTGGAWAKTPAGLK